MKKLFILFFFVVCFFNLHAQVGCCDNFAPTFYVDFTGANAGTQWISPPTVRQNTVCCGAAISRCIQFIITSDSNTCGFIFNQISGVEPGSYDLQMCCGPQLTKLDTEYLSSGIHSLMYCKPGNNIYQYQITSVTSCAGTAPPDSSCTLNCSLVTKAKDDIHPKTISVYPNPATNQLTVYGLQFTVGATWEIYNVLGEIVSSLKPKTINPKQEPVIDISSLQAGVYFLKIDDGGRMVVKRFLKE